MCKFLNLDWSLQNIIGFRPLKISQSGLSMISPSSLTPSSALGVTFCSADISFLTSSPGLGSVDDAVVVVDDVSVFGAGVVVEAFLEYFHLFVEV